MSKKTVHTQLKFPGYDEFGSNRKATGWGFPQGSTKAHCFVLGTSLCGKWLVAPSALSSDYDEARCQVCDDKFSQHEDHVKDESSVASCLLCLAGQ